MAFDFPDTNGLADGFRVTNPKTGTEYSWKAAEEKWVLINPTVTGDFVRRSGDIMSGPLYLGDGQHPLPEPIDILDDRQAVHKKYVDELVNNLSGGGFNFEKSGPFTWDGTGVAITDGLWQFFGITDPAYDGSVTEVVISVKDNNGGDWLEEDFEVGSTLIIENVDDDDYLEGLITDVDQSAPGYIQITYTLVRSQGVASGDQTVTVRESLDARYVNRKGGDDMEGPLELTGATADLKFGTAGGAIKSSTDNELLVVNEQAVAYEGASTDDSDLVNKFYVDEADDRLQLQINLNTNSIINNSQEIDTITDDVIKKNNDGLALVRHAETSFYIPEPFDLIVSYRKIGFEQTKNPENANQLHFVKFAIMVVDRKTGENYVGQQVNSLDQFGGNREYAPLSCPKVLSDSIIFAPGHHTDGNSFQAVRSSTADPDKPWVIEAYNNGVVSKHKGRIRWSVNLDDKRVLYMGHPLDGARPGQPPSNTQNPLEGDGPNVEQIICLLDTDDLVNGTPVETFTRQDLDGNDHTLDAYTKLIADDMGGAPAVINRGRLGERIYIVQAGRNIKRVEIGDLDNKEVTLVDETTQPLTFEYIENNSGVRRAYKGKVNGLTAYENRFLIWHSFAEGIMCFDTVLNTITNLYATPENIAYGVNEIDSIAPSVPQLFGSLYFVPETNTDWSGSSVDLKTIVVNSDLSVDEVPMPFSIYSKAGGWKCISSKRTSNNEFLCTNLGYYAYKYNAVDGTWVEYEITEEYGLGGVFRVNGVNTITPVCYYDGPGHSWSYKDGFYTELVNGLSPEIIENTDWSFLNPIDEILDQLYDSIDWLEYTNTNTTYPLTLVKQPAGWAGNGAPGEFWYDYEATPVHVGFRGGNQAHDNYFRPGTYVRLEHTSGVMYATVASSWWSNQVHMNLEDHHGDALIPGEEVTSISYGEPADLTVFVQKSGDTMTGDLEVPNLTVPGDITVENGSIIYSGTDEVIRFGGTGAFYKGTISTDEHLVNKAYVDSVVFDDITDDTTNIYVKRSGDEMSGDLVLNKDAILQLETEPLTSTGQNVIQSYDTNGKVNYQEYLKEVTNGAGDTATLYEYEITNSAISAWIFKGSGFVPMQIATDENIMRSPLRMSKSDIVIEEEGKLEFKDHGADAKLIEANREAGEDITLLHLNNASSGSSSNFYNISMGGNTFYNGLQIKGGSGADEVIWRVRSGSAGQMSFFKSVSFEDNIVKGIGDGVDDSDAANIGQVKNAFDKIVKAGAQGEYRLNNSPGVTAGEMFTYQSGGAFQPDPTLVEALYFYKQDLDGLQPDFAVLEDGDRITLVDVSNGAITRFRIQGAPVDNGNTFTVNVTHGDGDTLVNGDTYDIIFQSFDISVDLDDYLKLDASNSPLKGNLTIDVGYKGAGNEASLKLEGSRTGATNPAAHIEFRNASQHNNDYGMLSYRSSNNASDGEWFKFNKDVDFTGKGLHSVGYLSPSNANNKKIVLRNPSTDANGNAAVEIQRGANNRKSFALRGKNASGDDVDLLSTYMNSGGPDAVNYLGKQDGGANLATVGKVEEMIREQNLSEFVQHGPYTYAGPGATIGPGEFTADYGGFQSVTQFSFHNTNSDGTSANWSSMNVGESFSLAQKGDWSLIGGGTNDWAVASYEVTGFQTFTSATVIDVNCHHTYFINENGSASFNQPPIFTWLSDADTYVFEGAGVNENKLFYTAQKTTPAPAYYKYKTRTNNNEVGGVQLGQVIFLGTFTNPSYLVFNEKDLLGNGFQFGTNDISCPNSFVHFYRVTNDGGIQLCKTYRFDLLGGNKNQNKFEIPTPTEVYSATNGAANIPNPGTVTGNIDYLVSFDFNFATTRAADDLPYTVDEEGDTHWDNHRIEDVGTPVTATDAATKGYVDQAIEAAGDGDATKKGAFQWIPDYGTLPLGNWFFDGKTSSDYTQLVTQLTVNVADKDGNPWSQDDFTAGSVIRISNENDGDSNYIVATIESTESGGPSSVRVTFDMISAQGSAFGVQVVEVLTADEYYSSLASTGYVNTLLDRIKLLEQRLSDAGL